jgi:hypothetical protein
MGVGGTSVSATEAIMGAVPKEKAGIGSAMNDATRELGGTIGVAVVGSVYASVYAATLTATSIAQQLPAPALATARSSMAGALGVASRLYEGEATRLVAAANRAFLHGLTAGSWVAAGVALAGAALAVAFLPARPERGAVNRDFKATLAALADVSSAASRDRTSDVLTGEADGPARVRE